MSRTYDHLYQQVIREINKRTDKKTVTIDSRYSTQPSGIGGSIDSRSLAEIITTIASDLADLIEPRIISGLDISATTPPSDSITISSGQGTSDGRLWELSDEITLAIPFDSSTYVFYLVLYNNAIEITRTHDDTKCEIGKIIIPKPGVTNIIVDDKPNDSWYAWIVSARDIVYGEDDEFDDASVEKLRDVIGRILADNIVGNIKLSEDLKIINTQGSLELDSASVKILSDDGEILAKFNKNGTFFYDESGIEIAKFSIDEARIGNILVTQNSIQSGNFVSGNLGSGFQILDSGDAEFNNVLLRGKLTASVFEKDTVSVIGGNLLVMDGDILDTDMTALNNSTLVISGDTTFATNDILRIKDGIDDEWLQVVSRDNNTYTVTRDKAEAYASDSNPIWKKGTSVVNYGASGEGGVYLTSSETNSPYISIVSHTGGPWSSLTTHLRLGNLNGFLDYLTDKYGIGIGTSDAYLKYDATNGLQIKGSITVTGGNWSHPSDGTKIDGGDIYTNTINAESLNVSQLSAISADMGTITAGTVTGATLQTSGAGSRVVMNAANMTAYDVYSEEMFKLIFTGANVGDVIIGNYTSGAGMKWDRSAFQFNVKGGISASSGDFTGTVNVGSEGRVYIDGANEVIKVYDASSNLLVELGKLS